MALKVQRDMDHLKINAMDPSVHPITVQMVSKAQFMEQVLDPQAKQEDHLMDRELNHLLPVGRPMNYLHQCLLCHQGSNLDLLLVNVQPVARIPMFLDQWKGRDRSHQWLR